MITLLVPAYNEEAIIEQLVTTLYDTVQLDEEYELLVVNDGSSDRTAELLSAMQQRYPSLHVVHHPENLGLGRALRTGFHAACGRIIVTMDADLTHPPTLIAPLVKACDVDFVVASRYAHGGGMANVPFWRVLLSRMANWGFQCLFLTRLRDITAGFKAYKAESVRQIDIAARGFEVQLEITIRLLKQGATFKELPYVLKNREVGTSKMRYLKLLPVYFATLFALFRYRWGLGKTKYG